MCRVRDCVIVTGGAFSYSEHRAMGVLARFLSDLTAEVAGSEEKSS